MEEADVASNPDVGSSRNKAIGAAANSMPILTRLRSPPEMTGAEGLPTKESLTWYKFRHRSRMSTCFCISASFQSEGSRMRAE